LRDLNFFLGYKPFGTYTCVQSVHISDSVIDYKGR